MLWNSPVILIERSRVDRGWRGLIRHVAKLWKTIYVSSTRSCFLFTLYICSVFVFLLLSLTSSSSSFLLSIISSSSLSFKLSSYNSSSVNPRKKERTIGFNFFFFKILPYQKVTPILRIGSKNSIFRTISIYFSSFWFNFEHIIT